MSVSSEDTSAVNEMTVFDIIWDDILIEYVVPHLSIKDLFNLRCCSRLSKAFVEFVFRKLKTINLSNYNSPNIELAFDVLAKTCNNVRELSLAKCNWLNDCQLRTMLENNQHLISVNLNDCNSITAPSLQPIIINCKNLKILNLSKCYWLTVGAIDALVLHHGHHLQDVNISHCNTIETKSLILLLHKFLNLKVLSMAYLVCVTDTVLLTVSKNCKKLQHICLVGCDRITDRGIEYTILFY